MILSSQDFRNSYEKFYVQMRKYLWPYDALKALAFVEDAIYNSFIDFDVLDNALSKLLPYIKETMKDDPKLQKTFDEINDLLEDAAQDDVKIYSFLNKVSEVNPQADKQIRTIPEEEEEEI